MAPTRRSTRSKAEMAGNKTETAPNVPATRVAKKAKVAAKEPIEKEIEEKDVRRSTRARKGTNVESEAEKVAEAKAGDEYGAEEVNRVVKNGIEKADTIPAVAEPQTAPVSGVGPTVPPIKAKATRGRAAKGKTTATAPVEEEVVIVEASIAPATPAPTLRRSTRGNHEVSEDPTEGNSITVAPAAEKPKRGKKITSEIFETSAVENAAASSSATPHWAKKREIKAEEQTEVIADGQGEDVPEKTTAKGRKRKASVSKKGKGKAKKVHEELEAKEAEAEAEEPEIEEPEASENFEVEKIGTVVKEPIPAVEEEPTIDNDPVTNVAKEERKHSNKTSKPSKKATAATKKAAAKKALVTRKSTRGKKIEGVENQDEAAQLDQTDQIVEDTPMANPLAIMESSKEANDEETAPEQASEVLESSQVTEADDLHVEGTNKVPKTQDSGVFIDSFRSTQDGPEAIPKEQTDIKAVEQEAKEDSEVGTKSSDITRGSADSISVKNAGDESSGVASMNENTSSEEKTKKAESPIFAARNEYPKDQAEDGIENIVGAASQPTNTNKTKVPRPRKKSAATKKKERAAAIKKAKSQLQPEIDADGDINVNAEPEAEIDHKGAPSSSRIIDPVIVLGPRKSGISKKAPTVRRGRSAAVKQEVVVAESVQEDKIMPNQGNDAEPEIIGEKSETIQEIEPIDAVSEGASLRQSSNEAVTRTSGDVQDETVHVEIPGKPSEEVVSAHEEDEEFALPMSKPIILSPTRFTSPDPNLDPIKSSVPSSPVTFSVSHPQLHSSPLRNASQEPILASPGSVTTPRGPSPIKKWATPNKHTPSRLSQRGTPFKNLEDSRDIRKVASTPTRTLNVDVQSSPVMMPPPTPDAVAGDGRSPVKQTPTKEPLVGDVVLSNAKINLEMENKGLVNSSPIKNPTPIKADSFIRSSPAGRLSFSEDLPSPAARRLESGIPLLKSPVASSSSISSPIKKTKLDFLKDTKTSALSSSPSWNLSFTSENDDEDDDDNVGDDTFADRESFHDVEDLVNKLGEEEVSMESIHKEVVDQEETLVEKTAAVSSNIPPILEEDKREVDDSGSSNLDESKLFKLLDKAKNAVEQEEPTPLVPEAKGDIAECDLTFTASDNDFNEDIPSSPLDESPLKLQEFSYEPTASIFPPKPDNSKVEGGEEEEEEESDTEVFSPIMINNQSARKEEDTDWGEDEEDGKGIKFHLDPESTGGRLQEFRASSPPNFWRTQVSKATNVSPSSSPRTADQPGDETEFEKSYARGQEEVEKVQTVLGDDTFEQSYIRGLDIGSGKSYEGVNLLPDEEAQKTPVDMDNTFEQSYIRGLDMGSDQSYEGINLLPDEEAKKTPIDMDDTFEQSYARGIDIGSDQEYEGINLLPDEEKSEEIGEDTQFEMSFMRGVEEEKEEIKREQAERMKRERDEKITKGRKRFLEEPQEDFQALKKSKGKDGRRLTFHPDEPVSKKTSKKPRRMSDSTLPDRQYYLKNSRPDDVQTNWEEHIRRVKKERLAVYKIQRAYRAYRAARVEATKASTGDGAPSIEEGNEISPVIEVDENPPAAEVGEIQPITKGSALHHPPVRPSVPPGRKTRRSQVPLPAFSSIPPPSSGLPRIKRKTADGLETGGRVAKSNIPVSTSVSIPDPVLTMCNRHTTQNALFSAGIKFKIIKKPFPRPSEAVLDAATRKAAQESKERRWELMQETGCMLHPGEEEEWVNNDNSKVRWDPELVYICDDEEGEAPPKEDTKKFPERGVLKAPPPLTIHGNWIPAPNAPSLQISREPVEVSRVVYLGEDEQKEPAYGKKKPRK
ncbi:hypothetical protein DFP73DRAFT_555984 [Morchella snyderi]|nr:hypothetical protein DFP73DRAFT_555984 [Morchella snyderi]